jgi:dethiobiotin synthetase
MTAIFITATGTDIGKTFVAAGLIRHLRAAGRSVDALKPVATGFDPENADASDPGVLLAAMSRPVAPAEIARIAPWRFTAPLSPDMAARREDRTLDYNALLDFSRRSIAAHSGTLLIEGIGGIMVPLDDTHTVLDWMTALNIPLVLVTGSYLGSLSHTLTALDALKRRDLAIKTIVVNESPGSTVPLADTVQTLTRFAAPIPIVAMPRLLGAANSTSPLPLGEVGARSAPGEGLQYIESPRPPHPNPLLTPGRLRPSSRAMGEREHTAVEVAFSEIAALL